MWVFMTKRSCCRRRWFREGERVTNMFWSFCKVSQASCCCWLLFMDQKKVTSTRERKLREMIIFASAVAFSSSKNNSPISDSYVVLCLLGNIFTWLIFPSLHSGRVGSPLIHPPGKTQQKWWWRLILESLKIPSARLRPECIGKANKSILFGAEQEAINLTESHW